MRRDFCVSRDAITAEARNYAAEAVTFLRRGIACYARRKTLAGCHHWAVRNVCRFMRAIVHVASACDAAPGVAEVLTPLQNRWRYSCGAGAGAAA